MLGGVAFPSHQMVENKAADSSLATDSLVAITTYSRIRVKSFPNGSMCEESACSAGDTGNAGSIPGLGRSPGGVNGNPL